MSWLRFWSDGGLMDNYKLISRNAVAFVESSFFLNAATPGENPTAVSYFINIKKQYILCPKFAFFWHPGVLTRVGLVFLVVWRSSVKQGTS